MFCLIGCKFVWIMICKILVFIFECNSSFLWIRYSMFISCFWSRASQLDGVTSTRPWVSTIWCMYLGGGVTSAAISSLTWKCTVIRYTCLTHCHRNGISLSHVVQHQLADVVILLVSRFLFYGWEISMCIFPFVSAILTHFAHCRVSQLLVSFSHSPEYSAIWHLKWILQKTYRPSIMCIKMNNTQFWGLKL